MRAKTIEFEAEWVEAVEDQELTAVVLYEEGEDIEPGDTLNAEYGGSQFVQAHVMSVAEVEARDAFEAVKALLGDMPCKNNEDVVSALDARYGKAISEDDKVRVIVFEIIE